MFEAVNDGVQLIVGYPDKGPSDEKFFEDRIADYGVASSRNRAVNNNTSLFLAVAGWLIIVGMLVLLGLLTFALRST